MTVKEQEWRDRSLLGLWGPVQYHRATLTERPSIWLVRSGRSPTYEDYHDALEAMVRDGLLVTSAPVPGVPAIKYCLRDAGITERTRVADELAAKIGTTPRSS